VLPSVQPDGRARPTGAEAVTIPVAATTLAAGTSIFNGLAGDNHTLTWTDQVSRRLLQLPA